MLSLLHLAIVATYLGAPAGVALHALLAGPRAGRSVAARRASFALTVLSAFLMAVTLCVVYGRKLQEHVPFKQVLIATYFGAGLLLVLRGLDWVLWLSLRRMFHLHAAGAPNFWRGVRTALMLVTRSTVLAGVGLPLVMAVAMTYRPKVLPRDTPMSQLGFHYQRVEFQSSDGVSLAGWWVPATNRPRGEAGLDWGRHTVVLCHGLASSKSNQLILARRLVPGGYNVLAFDFRAHGESGGQLTAYGAAEKRDVLAAVRWTLDHHPEEAQQIYGVGASTGAAALISAAADNSPEGRAIAAVATYAAYDELALLVHDVTSSTFEQPLAWLLEHVSLPVAAAHVGVNLCDYAPAQEVKTLWPRPILFLHAVEDEIIPFARGRALYDAADQPKYHVWFPHGGHNDVMTSEAAAAIVLQFFRTARSIPVI